MEFSLGELVNLKYGKDQKKVKNPNGKYPIFGTGGFIGYADDYLYDKPSILIGRKGTIDKIKYVDKPFWTIDTLFYTEINSELVDAKYLYYKLSTINFLFYNEGTTIPSLRTETLNRIKIDLPNLEIQKKVSNFLNDIDNKIKINESIIANLEELSQTIFKRWFVDFEFPDENGNPYKSSQGRFINTNKGRIPINSSIGRIDDIGTIFGGGTPSKKVSHYYTSSDISWITPKDLSNDSSRFIFKGKTDITEQGLKNSSARLLPKNTILFSSRAPIGYIAIAGQQVSTNQGFKSIVPNKGFSQYYIYFVLKQMIPVIEQSAGGSTFKEISGNGLKNIEIILPQKKTVKQFNDIVSIYFEEIKNLETQNKLLKAFRDTLLPKLMSGEIELPENLEV